MEKSYWKVTHQPLITQFLLLFCRRRSERRGKDWVFVYKTLRDRHYLMDLYRAPKPKRRFQLFRR